MRTRTIITRTIIEANEERCKNGGRKVEYSVVPFIRHTSTVRLLPKKNRKKMPALDVSDDIDMTGDANRI